MTWMDNQSENTIVIFRSNNGPATWRYNAGLRGKKGHLYDGGTRVTELSGREAMEIKEVLLRRGNP